MVTRALDAVTVDPVARTATIGAGATWGAVTAAAAPYGLAPLNGSSPSVGAVSYTLGGGLGILAREFGYAADHVRSLEVVTADGVPRRVTPEREPELFWGLRGGGRRLGVVTSMEIGLVAVERLYGGAIAFDGERAAEVMARYLEWTRTVPASLDVLVGRAALPGPAAGARGGARTVRRLGAGRLHGGRGRGRAAGGPAAGRRSGPGGLAAGDAVHREPHHPQRSAVPARVLRGGAGAAGWTPSGAPGCWNWPGPGRR
ncbi:hypothetical protein SCALM49S_05657 [Streptomyces californicus]